MLNGILTIGPPKLAMDLATRSDPITAFNERAKASGWTFTCGPATGFKHPQLVHALAIWRARANGRAMPSRADMTARVMKPFIRQMSILERVGAGKAARYRVRLHGSVLASYTGDKTGRFLDEVLPVATACSYAGVYDTALELLSPLRLVSRYQSPKIDYLSGESLVAPLATSGKGLPLILSVTYVQPRGNGAVP